MFQSLEIQQEMAAISAIANAPRRTERDEFEDSQSAYENNNYHKPLDSEDFATDRGWWFHCPECDGETRVSGYVPRCKYCGSTPNKKGNA